MKHSRKMFLIPEELMTLIQDKTEIQTSPLIRSMSHLNQQMDSIVNNSKLPTETKLRNHDQVFQRYLNLQHQQENYIPTVRVQSTVEAEPQESQPPPPQPVSDSEILQTIPQKYKAQAEGLLRWMKKTPGAVEWDDKGVVTLDGKSIQGSSISDLINDTIRERKGFTPKGRNDFTQILAKLNTPEDFVRNNNRRKLMTLLKTGGRLPPTTPDVSEILGLPTPPTAPKKGLLSPALQKKRAKVPLRGKRTLDWINY